jgi:hypothetical protein
MEVKLMPMKTPTDPDMTFLGVKVSQLEDIAAREIFAEIVRLVAQKYVDAHYAEIAAMLDQQAIANLSIAEAAKKIAEQIALRPVPIDTASIAREVARRIRR